MKVRQTIRTSLKVKPLDKIQQTVPQESRAQKPKNGITVTIARLFPSSKLQPSFTALTTTTILFHIAQIRRNHTNSVN